MWRWSALPCPQGRHVGREETRPGHHGHGRDDEQIPHNDIIPDQSPIQRGKEKSDTEGEPEQVPDVVHFVVPLIRLFLPATKVNDIVVREVAP